jgi:deoxyribonuclease V
MLKIAIDTYYLSDSDAYTVGVIFKDWSDSEPFRIISCHTQDFASYIPGEFYKRELPCILDLLKDVDLDFYDTIIIDGFIRLKGNDNEVHQGLGAHLAQALGNRLHDRLDIVGIAKTLFCKSDEISMLLKRNNAKPLYCQSYKGLSLVPLFKMHGDYRIPTLLKILDKQTKVGKI